MVGITGTTVERPAGNTGVVTSGTVTGGGGGLPPAADISEFIDRLSPTHRWKLDEVAGPTLADSGVGTTVDLTVAGTLTFQQGGPDASTEAMSRTIAGFARNVTLGYDTATTGTIFAFVRNPGTLGVYMTPNNTVDETNEMSFARDTIFNVSGTPRVGFTAFLAGATNRRVFEGGVDVTTHGTDNLWHLYGWTQDGTGGLPRLYIDGVEDTGVFSTPTGTAPPVDVWTAGVADANSRAVIFNGRFTTVTQNYTGRASELNVINATIMTEAQFAELFALVTN
jgi:hypothetical protein